MCAGLFQCSGNAGYFLFSRQSAGYGGGAPGALDYYEDVKSKAELKKAIQNEKFLASSYAARRDDNTAIGNFIMASINNGQQEYHAKRAKHLEWVKQFLGY